MPIANDGLETILLAELRLGLPPLFYYRLLESDDDWTFVLKVHALFEGTLTALIREKLALRRVQHETLTPRDTFVARIHLANRLNLLEPDYEAFLRALNHLRNDITHNIRFLGFDLRRYVDGLTPAEFTRAAKSLAAGVRSMPFNANTPPPLPLRTSPVCRRLSTSREFWWHHHPKVALWMAGACTLDLISLQWHFERTGTTFSQQDPHLEARLQDLRLDPAVIEYRKNLSNLF